jgi:hypothetical protein
MNAARYVDAGRVEFDEARLAQAHAAASDARLADLRARRHATEVIGDPMSAVWSKFVSGVMNPLGALDGDTPRVTIRATCTC